MKKKIRYRVQDKTIEREWNYIPVRYIIAVMISLLEILAIIGILFLLCYFVPYFYLAAFATQVFCVIKIIASDDNPDYKVPWLLFVMILPVAGFMLYFLFYSRKLQRKFIRRFKKLQEKGYEKRDEKEFHFLKGADPAAYSQAKMLCEIADTHLFSNTKTEFYPLGEQMHEALLQDLQKAEKFIFMEYFIIEEGKFWDSILAVLKEKAASGVSVRVVYDDIGCMSTLPGNYAKQLKKVGIQAVPFSRLRGNADSEFNNRSHRKIAVIDGLVAYTGGVNIADEYINEKQRFGHWKDVGLRLEGEGVKELTQLFTIDYGINVRKAPQEMDGLYPETSAQAEGFVIPFGDGPRPLYERRVGKSVIQNMLAMATEYVWMASPYLIIDNELCQAIENAALRGVDVRIIVPHIPDKKLVFEATRSFYKRLLSAGVKIYEYTPGFIHAKYYIADGKIAILGTINLDYRSLVHHFENGVWMYKTECVKQIEADFLQTQEKSEEILKENLKSGLFRRILRSLVRIFAPLL